ncbi:MAG: ABC transporter ATP-binding protein [Leptospirales bacterium]|nr:ABC transporter ATP-binding protein [Leptospirales bacterium]
MIEVKHLTRSYGSVSPLTVLHNVSLKVEAGEFVAITGPSGSGKSTLMGLMAGLDRPTSGQVFIQNEDITQASENELSRLRGEKVGFVFQNFLLMQTLTALENTMLPAEILGRELAEKRARELLARVGLGERVDHYPSQLSGGEMQRVAIARAFINTPPVLFADEPTGNLDSKNGQKIVELLLELNRTYESTLILITHNPELARLSNREIRLKDGRIVEILAHRGGSHKKTAAASKGAALGATRRAPAKSKGTKRK